MYVSHLSTRLESFSQVSHQEVLPCNMFSTSPIPHSKQWSQAINQPAYMTTERPDILDLVKLQNFMFQFSFELFTLFFLSFLFQFLLQWIQIIFSDKNSNKLFENKLLGMGKTAKLERKQLAHSLLKTMKIFFWQKPVSVVGGCCLTVRNKTSNIICHSSLQGWNPPSWVPPLSEAN